MKLRACIILLLIISSGSARAQFLTLNSKDGLNGKPKNEFNRFGDNTRMQFEFEYYF